MDLIVSEPRAVTGEEAGKFRVPRGMKAEMRLSDIHKR